MNLTNLFKIAFKALSNNKLRGFLTMLGIIIGVAAVIAILGVVFRERIMKVLERSHKKKD